MSQTTYNTRPNIGAVGLPAYAGSQEVAVFSYANPNAVIGFGLAVGKVSGSEHACDILTSGAQVLGVSVRSLSELSGKYPVNSAVGVMSFGQIWVQPEVDVTPDDQVWVRITGKTQTYVITFSGDIIALDVFTCKLNGAAVSVPFNGTNGQTLTDIQTALEALPLVTSATPGAHNITVVSSVKGEVLNFTNLALSGSASPALVSGADTVLGRFDAEGGQFRNDTDGGTAIQLKNARWLTSSADYTEDTIKLAVVDIFEPINN